MLSDVRAMLGYSVRATDDALGKVDDLLINDETWRLRYLVVDTRRWLPSRQVLLAPASLGSPDHTEHEVPVNLTKQQVQDSPPVEADKPVSRQQEEALAMHYDWPADWAAPSLSAGGPIVGAEAKRRTDVPASAMEGSLEERVAQESDTHLRSAKELSGYEVVGRDGKVGKVDDFLIDDKDWVLRYFVIDTGGLFSHNRVLLPTDAATSINWKDKSVHFDLTGKQIEESPGYDPSVPLNRGYEERLYSHFGFTPYWTP